MCVPGTPSNTNSRIRVPKVMEPDHRHLKRGREPAHEIGPTLRRPGGMDGGAIDLAEHEIAIVIRLPSEATLELLRLTVLANGIDHHAIERDRAL